MATITRIAGQVAHVDVDGTRVRVTASPHGVTEFIIGFGSDTPRRYVWSRNIIFDADGDIATPSADTDIILSADLAIATYMGTL